MSAFRRGGRQGSRFTSDPPLIKLVEEYLHHNSHVSVISIETMGEEIRRKSFRYSRMKAPVFKEQLQRAFDIFRANANEAYEDLTGANIELDDTPLTEDTLKQMEGFQTEDSESCSSDIEETDVVARDAGGNQMKGLYMSNEEEGDNRAPSQSECKNDSMEDSSNWKPELENDDGSTKPGNDSRSVASIDSNTNTEMSVLSDYLKDKYVSPSTAKSIDAEVADEEDESDVEIIEEVPSEKSTWITRLPVAPPPPTLSKVSQRVVSTLLDIARDPSVASVTEKLRNQAKAANQGQKYESSTRGTKRKTTGGTEDTASTGTNDDFLRKRLKKEVSVIVDTGVKLQDFAGSDKSVEEICKLLMHLKHPEVYETLGVTPPRGFLLHGPPGTGKTLLANAIAGELQLPVLKIAGTELVSGISGESESNIRELFNQAVTLAPCVIFIDEIDSVTPRRENVNKEMERRIVAQLLSCIDELASKEKGNQVLLIGATNRIEAIDTALRRAGRFDREICLGIPDEKSREKILSVICRNLKLEPELRMTTLARLTPGYVGADLKALIREAAVQAVNRKLQMEELNKTQFEEENERNVSNMEVDQNGALQEGCCEKETLVSSTKEEDMQQTKKAAIANESLDPLRWIKETAPLTEEQLADLFICSVDFELAIKIVQPSSKREGFATVPDTTWDDIGALQNIRDELQVSILGPVKHADAFNKLGLTTPAGVLLCGPPGCGKTLLAKAVANEAGINFISVKGPELLNMYVGESERAVRQCFLRARNSSPCVIFFDELDALCPRRSDAADSGSSGRIVNQLLTEMDGIEGRQGVFVMAATNRPDIIDPAVLRPGRLDKILFVNLPSPSDRAEILKTITKNSTKPIMDDDVNLEDIATSAECENYTGADLAALVREASIAAFRELVLNQKGDSCSTNELKVSNRHFTTAFTKTKPSVGKEDRNKYKLMEEKYSTIR